jgi:hypothetical protein
MDFLGASGIYTLLLVCSVISGLLIFFAKHVK